MGSKVSRLISKQQITGAFSDDQQCFFGLELPFGSEQLLFLQSELEQDRNAHINAISLSCIKDDAIALGNFISNNTSLTSLSVFSPHHRESFGDAGSCHLFKALAVNTTLKSFTFVEAGVTTTSIPALVEMVHSNKGLQELTFSRCNQLEDGAAELLEAIMKEGRIEKLCLMLSVASAKPVSPMCAVLKNYGNSKTFKRLDLSFCKIESDGACMLAEVLQEEPSCLQELVLKHCYMDLSAAAALSNALKRNSSLALLDVCGNRLGPDAGKAFGEMLVENIGLRQLMVKGCDLANEGGDAIVEALKRNTTLKTLDLSSNRLRSGEAITKMLIRNSTLTKLDISDQSHLQSDAMKSIVDAMRANTAIQELNLSFCGVYGQAAAADVADMLKSNFSLRVLNFSDSDVSEEAFVAFAEAAVGKRHLASLMLTHRASETMRKRCSSILMQGNGSLVFSGQLFKDVCARNRAMHTKAREAVQALRVLRWRQGDSILHMMAKEVVKMIGVALWNTRTEMAVWAKQK